MLENGILKYATTRQDVSMGPGCTRAAFPMGSGQGWHPTDPMRKGVFPLTGIPGLPQVLKGKLHGAIDVRLSVMSVNKKAQRVDLDTEENIYHLKVLLGLRWPWGGCWVVSPPINFPLSHRSSPQSSSPAG